MSAVTEPPDLLVELADAFVLCGVSADVRDLVVDALTRTEEEEEDDRERA